jgi:hypothetical protein
MDGVGGGGGAWTRFLSSIFSVGGSGGSADMPSRAGATGDGPSEKYGEERVAVRERQSQSSRVNQLEAQQRGERPQNLTRTKSVALSPVLLLVSTAWSAIIFESDSG